MADSITLTIEAGDETNELTVPTAVLGMLREDEETDPEIIGDIAMFGLAQRLHGAVHHSQGEPPAELAEAESDLMDLFEERFGATFGELTGHDH